MTDAEIRLEVLKLATQIELAIFDLRDDGRSRETLQDDIKATADTLHEYVTTTHG